MILSHFFALFVHISSLSVTVDSPPNSVRNILVGAVTEGGGGREIY